MAQRNSTGRGASRTATRNRPGNQTPNTPRISEAEIGRLRVDELRGQLRRHGVDGTSRLRKPELVQTLVRALRSERRSGDRARQTRPSGRESSARTDRRTSAGRSRTETRARSESRAQAQQRAESRTRSRQRAQARERSEERARERKRASSRAETRPAAARKSPVERRSRAESRSAMATRARKVTSAGQSRSTVRGASANRNTSTSRASTSRSSSTSRSASGGRSASTRAASRSPSARSVSSRREGAREGGASSRSLRYAQPINSLQDRPERPGRSLVTTNHDVIQRWARERKAKPATITGTEHDGHAGVLTFDFPGYSSSRRLQHITWAQWFRAFDERNLNLIYQETLRTGRPSNFFRTESPNREDG